MGPVLAAQKAVRNPNRKIDPRQQKPEELGPARIDFAADLVAPDDPEQEQRDDDGLDDQRLQDQEGDVQPVDGSQVDHDQKKEQKPLQGQRLDEGLDPAGREHSRGWSSRTG